MVFYYYRRILTNFKSFKRFSETLRYFKEFKKILNVVKVEGISRSLYEFQEILRNFEGF